MGWLKQIYYKIKYFSKFKKILKNRFYQMWEYKTPIDNKNTIETNIDNNDFNRLSKEDLELIEKLYPGLSK